jgi:hypothetical protein
VVVAGGAEAEPDGGASPGAEEMASTAKPNEKPGAPAPAPADASAARERFMMVAGRI